jgi:hypothetical protein
LSDGGRKRELPGAVRRVFERRNGVRCGMNRTNPYRRLVRVKQRVAIHRHPVFCVCNRVHGNCAQILPGHQIVQALRRGLFVSGVVLDRVIQDPEVGFQHRFTRAKHSIPVMYARDRREDYYDRHHHHEFDQRKSTPACAPPLANRSSLLMLRYRHSVSREDWQSLYQSEYLVPSSAVPVDFE